VVFGVSSSSRRLLGVNSAIGNVPSARPRACRVYDKEIENRTLDHAHGLRQITLKDFVQNQAWCDIAAPACELLAWPRARPSGEDTLL
jgi:hypothetical protein